MAYGCGWCRSVAVLLAAGLALAGCGWVGSSDPDRGGGISPPPGATLLETATAGEHLAGAMRAAGPVEFSVALTVTSEHADWQTERTGTIQWHDTGADVDLTWRAVDAGPVAGHEGRVAIVGDDAYLGGDFVSSLVDGTSASWVHLTGADRDPSDLWRVVDETARWATPEVHLAVLATTVELRPGRWEEFADGGSGPWYEGEAATGEPAAGDDQAPANRDTELDVVWRAFAAAGVETVPFQLLVDEDDLPRELTVQAEADGIGLDLSVTYVGWGGTEPVRAPGDAIAWAEVARP